MLIPENKPILQVAFRNDSISEKVSDDIKNEVKFIFLRW